MIVNGEQIELSKLASPEISGLLGYYNLNKDRVAIEINGSIVKKSGYEKISLVDTDKIEIIHFVGGGAQWTQRR
ncbi:MAG: sulfur carrier protein ThiS [Leptospirales bacterium]